METFKLLNTWDSEVNCDCPEGDIEFPILGPLERVCWLDNAALWFTKEPDPGPELTITGTELIIWPGPTLGMLDTDITLWDCPEEQSLLAQRKETIKNFNNFKNKY